VENETHHPLFVEHFREYVEKKLGESFDSLNDVVRSKYMSRFFAEKVLAPRNLIIPTIEEDVLACIVDGTNDQGVDFICREDGVVLIIQAKFSGGGRKAAKRRPEEAADFEYFRNVLNRLQDFRSKQMAETLRDICAEIDWDRDRFQLYYITLRQLTTDQANTKEWTALPIDGMPDLADRTEVYLLNENKLNLELRDTLSLDRAEAWEATLLATANQGSEPWMHLGSGDTRSCYVGRVSGAELANLFSKHRSSIFSLNIRNYIGDTATNKAIKKTAIGAPEEFFFFNNGISALAESIAPDTKDPRILRCKNLSIVNGAQTVRSLHKTQTDNPVAAKKTQVLIRITETQSKKTTREQEFLDSVTKFNNTQNAIKISDFRSNDKIQHDIRAKFSELPSLSGKKFSYKNKRSGPAERDGKKGSDISIGMEEFTKTLYAFQYGPDDVYGGTGHVFDATAEGGYAKLFGSGGEVLPALTTEMFEKYAGIWFVCNKARELWKEESRKTKHSALERRWMFYYALGCVIRKAYENLETQYQTDLKKLSRPAWMNDGPDGITQKAISRQSRFAMQCMKQAYEENAKTGASHRNWFRSPATLEAIKNRINDSWIIVEEHAADYRLRQK
jgi:hypothetical protein